MSDLVAEFLAREQEQFGDIEDFKFDDIHTESLNNQIYYQNEDIDDVSNETDNQVNTDFNDFKPQETESDNSYQYSTALTRIESEKIRLWRIEFDARLEAKDAEELKRKLDEEQEARKELNDWNDAHTVKSNNMKAVNKENERDFIEDRDEPLPGSEWHRVCQMCDFGSRSTMGVSSTAVVVGARGSIINNETMVPLVTIKDTGRMKSILLSLKTDPLVRG